MPRMISMPVIGLPLRSSLHLSQAGLGLLGMSSSTIRPLSVPLTASAISTIDLAWPVSSSMVFERPTAGSAASAGRQSANNPAATRSLDRKWYMVPPGGLCVGPPSGSKEHLGRYVRWSIQQVQGHGYRPAKHGVQDPATPHARPGYRAPGRTECPGGEAAL